MYYVYIIQNESNGLYYGYTSDLKKRIDQHNSGKSFYTKNHKWRLVYYEAYVSKIDAQSREKRLKLFGQALAQLKHRIKDSLSKG